MSVNLGFGPGQVVQELYYDQDTEPQVALSVQNQTGSAMVDYDYDDVVDGVVLWWRADDAEEEELADVLLDALANLDDSGGSIWVLSPKTGTAGAVLPHDVEDAAKIVGLKTTSSQTVGEDWVGICLVARNRG